MFVAMFVDNACGPVRPSARRAMFVAMFVDNACGPGWPSVRRAMFVDQWRERDALRQEGHVPINQ